MNVRLVEALIQKYGMFAIFNIANLLVLTYIPCHKLISKL